MRQLIIACLVFGVLVPRPAFAEDDDWARVQKYLAGIELPDAWGVETFDCSGKWRSDTFCELIRAASIRFYDKDDYVKSIWYASAALRKKPRSRRALKYIGRSLVELGRTDEALPYLERAADLEEAPYALDDYIYTLTRTTRGAELQSRALRLAELKAYHDDDAWNWWATAELHYQSGRYEAARARAKRILETDPDDPDTWLYHSWIMTSLDELDEAVESATRGLQAYESLSAAARKKERDREKHYDGIVYLERLRGNLERAEKIARSLTRSDDEKWREKSARRLARIVFEARGARAALEVADELAVEDENLRADLRFWKAVEQGTVAEFEPSDARDLSDTEQFTRLVLLDRRDALEEWAARQDRDSDSGRWLEQVDFRDPECNALGDASLDWHSARPDYMDLWKEALAGAAFDLVCGDNPSPGFNVRSDAPPADAEVARALHGAAVLWAVGDHDDSYRMASKLPAKGPPVLHRFGVWIAAANKDEKEFERHKRLASRGRATRELRLAELYFALKRGRVGEARKIWNAMPPKDRYPMILPSYMPLLGHRVVEAALELDADFAVELAEAWFRTDGPLDRSIWKLVQKTDTTIARVQ
jgi:tetratricopeptide (TPR) repeat protein